MDYNTLTGGSWVKTDDNNIEWIDNSLMGGKKSGRVGSHGAMWSDEGNGTQRYKSLSKNHIKLKKKNVPCKLSQSKRGVLYIRSNSGGKKIKNRKASKWNKFVKDNIIQGQNFNEQIKELSKRYKLEKNDPNKKKRRGSKKKVTTREFNKAEKLIEKYKEQQQLRLGNAPTTSANS